MNSVTDREKPHLNTVTSFECVKEARVLVIFSCRISFANYPFSSLLWQLYVYTSRSLSAY